MRWLEGLRLRFDHLLRRFGLVRLEHYGLVLTPDDRILATRSTVLDDGIGGKIVGWRETDLAALELDRWPAAAKVVKSGGRPLITQPLPTVARPPVFFAPEPPPLPPPPAPLRVVPMPAVAIAPDTAVEEDDEWEWQIAMARARAAAEAIDAPAPPRRMPRATGRVNEAPRMRAQVPDRLEDTVRTKPAKPVTNRFEDTIRTKPVANRLEDTIRTQAPANDAQRAYRLPGVSTAPLPRIVGKR